MHTSATHSRLRAHACAVPSQDRIQELQRRIDKMQPKLDAQRKTLTEFEGVVKELKRKLSDQSPEVRCARVNVSFVMKRELAAATEFTYSTLH
jgi:hypothetical protein